MTSEKMPENAEKHICESCGFKCSKMSNFTKHLATAKHKMLTNADDLPPNTSKKEPIKFNCSCGKIYGHRQSLYKHKLVCIVKTPPTNAEGPLQNEIIVIDPSTRRSTLETAIEKRDRIIDEVLKDNQEMKSLIVMLVQKHQENAPNMGNVTNTNTNTNTNSHNNTLNFYLTHTCKDAESIHDFTERFVERSAGFFKDNFRQIADNQTNFASGVYDIFWKCLEEKPQTEKFIQTTDVKNGVLYVKEKKKDEQRQLCGEAEFVKYMDGFEKAGLNLGHAMNKAFLPLQMEFVETMKAECGMPPNEEDFEDEDEYETARHKYKERVIEMKHKMCMQTHKATTIFDHKQQRDEILSKTRRAKEPIE